MSDKVQANWCVDALREPGTLSRILEFFVLRGIELEHVVASQIEADRQTVHLSTSATTADEASVIAAKIGQIVTVLSVSFSTKAKDAASQSTHLTLRAAG